VSPLSIAAGGDVISHLVNGHELHFGPWTIPLGSLTRHVLMMILAAFVVGASCIYAARRAVRDQGRGLFANMVEATALFVRDEIARPGIGHHHYKAWFPFVATLFFFILGCNLIGLLPPPLGATATGNITVTGGLAGITLGAMIVPHGVPLWLWPAIFLIEAVGLVTKPFALMVRLFANMTAGHVILAILGGFLAFGNVGIGTFLAKSVYVGVPTVGFFLFILIFEIAIAFIQAFIFSYLSSIFIGLSLSHEH
jgi:F-type H+-transporting ATPase subunit a